MWRQRLMQILFCLLLLSLPPLRGVWSQSEKNSALLKEQIKNVAGKTGEHRQSALEKGLNILLDQGDFDTVDKWLEKFPEPKEPYPNGKTVLMYAAEAGKIDVVSELIKWDESAKKWTCKYSSADPSDYINRINHCRNLTEKTCGYTALMYASSIGNIEIVNYLLNAGADVSMKCRIGQFTALQIAQNAGKIDTAGVLEKKVEADERKLAEKKKALDEPTVWWPIFESNSTVIGWALGIIGLGVVLYRRENKDPFLLFLFLVVCLGGIVYGIAWWRNR